MVPVVVVIVVVDRGFRVQVVRLNAGLRRFVGTLWQTQPPPLADPC
jgi:hypothetical protein